MSHILMASSDSTTNKSNVIFSPLMTHSQIARATKELFIGQQFLVEKGLVKCVELQPKTRKIVVSADSEQLINLEELSERTNAIYEPD
jgi:hypothetical protein